MDSNTLRQKFLDYFAQHQHQVVASSPLVPGNDPTLLFTNAGMVQFKDAFLGRDPRSYTRAVSSQRCVRAGGKHNDLENVGYTARHHTFFEMLGNFSFGDYFKQDAIRYAWEFVTSQQWLALDPERLLVTVYESDDEAFDIWHKDMGLPVERIVRIGDKPGGGSDNFWQMGDTGPCGPCSEIFYDHGAEIPGGPPGSPDEDGDRWIEIWNLVFMQYDRAADGTLTPLPKPSVDTGMGLERICAVLQHVHSNYQIDLFQHLLQAVASATGNAQIGQSHQVIADHIRATAFLIIDGVVPANEGRGYVLRRIMRRAIRHGYKLGANDVFFYKLVPALAEVMGEAYPELREQSARLQQVIKAEEQAFAQTLANGMKILDEAIAEAEGSISGGTVFKLYDTYGFPVDLTADIARERGLQVDEAGFEREMSAQRERARAASKFQAGSSSELQIDAQSEFTGYEASSEQTRLIAILRDGQAVDSLQAGEEAVLFLERTPFYAESGGQVGDAGMIEAADARFKVSDVQALKPGAPGHIGKLQMGSLKLGDSVAAKIDVQRRAAIQRNHSATHLLHAVLREVLGKHVQQKGSLVAPDRLRFDFSHHQAMTADELQTVEEQVNAQVLANVATDVSLCSYDEAIASGAMALFGEKYGDRVRVLKFGEFSTELCGGCHVQRTGDIGLFKIIAEGGVAAGVRRVEAITGLGAVQWVREADQQLQGLARQLKTSRDELGDKLEQLQSRNRKLEKELATAADKIAARTGGALADQAVEVGGVKLLAAKLEGADVPRLRSTMDQLKNKLGSAVILLGSSAGEKVSLIAGVTADLTDRYKAGDLVRHAAEQVGGKGGGRPDMAQAGGNQPENLDQALASAAAWLQAQISA